MQEVLYSIAFGMLPAATSARAKVYKRGSDLHDFTWQTPSVSIEAK